MKKILFVLSAFLVFSCSKKEVPEEVAEDPAIPLSTYQKIYGANSININEGFVYINTDGVPDHKSPHFKDTQWENEKYIPYDNSNPWHDSGKPFVFQPSRISAGNFTFKLPIRPKKNTVGGIFSGSAQVLGIALNGVIFNKDNSHNMRGNNSLDQHNGHPVHAYQWQPNNPAKGTYFYHGEPFWLTKNNNKDGLMGFLLDGFPIYGPEENGSIVQSIDIDKHNGHTHSTKDFPNGIYHYHMNIRDQDSRSVNMLKSTWGFYGNIGSDIGGEFIVN